MWLAALIAFQAVSGVHGRCASDHEDCSHSGCCRDRSKKCYKKDGWWASCKSHCTPGIHHHDPPWARTPWSCELISSSHKDCAAAHENCDHLGCCKDQGFKCYQKNAHWASCRSSCAPGIHHHDPPQHRTPWSCTVITPHGGGNGGDGTSPGGGNGGGGTSPGGWLGTLKSTHFWDCNGASCDAPTLQPWEEREYKAAPHYAPMDPAKFGGSKYGEKLWMVGAASDALSDALGGDHSCCGSDNKGGGGCGKCLLVQNPAADNSAWTVVVMKKSRCPPDSTGCDKPHMDFAVPGFDHQNYSIANVCGSGKKSDTYISKAQSHICGAVPPKQCNCHGLPSNTPEQRVLKDGCLLFKTWGWHHGVPDLKYKPVECPAGFIERVRVGSAFGPGGVISFYDNSSTSSAIHDDVTLAGTDASARMKPLLFAAPILLIVGSGIFAGLRRRSASQVQHQLHSTLTDSEDMEQ